MRPSGKIVSAIVRAGAVLAFLAAPFAPAALSAAITQMSAAASSAAFMPHGMCYLWNPALMILHIASDSLIAIAYFSIPAMLLFFIRKRDDIPLRGPIAMFGIFIVACGVTHVLDVWTIWHPAYWLAGGVKALTAVVSIATALMLVTLVPKALTFRSPRDFERINLELEERYRRLVETAQEGMWTVDAAGRILSVNRKLASLLGYAQEELVGRSQFDFIPTEQRNAETERFTRQKNALASNDERSFQSRDGATLWLLGSSNPIVDGAKKCTGVLETFIDVTQRRQAQLELARSEDRYRTLAEGLPQMIWAADREGGITYFSSRWSRYTARSMDELRRWGWEPIVHPDDLPPLLEAWKTALREGGPFEAEHRLLRGDGAYRWFLVRALPMRDEAGTIVQWTGTATDIDDQKRSLEAQRRLTDQLVVIVEATDRLSNSLDPQESLEVLCDLITPRFADWMAVNVVEADGRIRNVALACSDPAKAAAAAALRGGYYLDPNARGAVVQVIRTKRPFVTSDYSSSQEDFKPAYPDKQSALAELGLSSVICVPILVRDEVFGVITAIWSESDRRYSDAEVTFFEQLARRIAVAYDEAARHSVAHINEEISRRVMQSSQDCIAVLDLDGHLMTVNEQGAASFLAAGTDLQPGYEWLSCWRIDHRPAVSGAIAAARAGSTGNYQGCLRGDGELPTWWDVVLTPITNLAGRPTQLLAISRNITRQKGHESQLEAIAARYRAFANAIPAIAFTATAEGVLDFVNDRWMEYTGLSYHISLGQGLITVTHPDERSTLTAEWFAALATGQSHETETRLRRAADGVYRWHLIRATPIRDREGKIVQWFGTGTDIDDQKRAEAALSEARDVALNAATMKTQFVATMSHEIRTPISGVIGMTELLLITTLTDEQREYANVVRDSGQSLLRVINDILDYSKLDAGKMQLEALEFKVESQIKSVADLLRAQSEGKRIVLTWHVEPGVPEKLVGDPGRLRQILVNLMGNAIKFTPWGGLVHVVVTRLSGNADTTRVRFEIKDTGVGIPDDVQARLFVAFSQADGSTTRKYGGTGLGLSICKQLVSLMNGTIGVDSAPGEGSCFWFTIDFVNAGLSGNDATAVPAGGDRRAKAHTGDVRILLVEDNQVNQLLALRQFKQLGFALKMASNGREALAAVAATHFDLVFMDCHMPEMDGFETTREIRRLEEATGRHLPIVAMTADAQIEDQAACLAAGMDDYLSKPSSLTQIRAVLDRWLPNT